MKPPKAVNII